MSDLDFQLFIPLDKSKTDDEKQMVYGYASVEEPDFSGEIMDFETTLPYAMAWSEDAYKRTGGLSRGNLRGQHNEKIAAGVLTEFSADKTKRAFPIAAHVVDKQEWIKVKTGTYSGLSWGGKYVNRWHDGNYIRYTAKPIELSLVDAPCVPSATFQMVKGGNVLIKSWSQPKHKLLLVGEDDMTNVVVNIPISALKGGDPISISAQQADLAKAMPQGPSITNVLIAADKENPPEPIAQKPDFSVNVVDDQKKVLPISPDLANVESGAQAAERHPPVVNITPEVEKVIAQSESQLPATYTPPIGVRDIAMRGLEGVKDNDVAKLISSGAPLTLGFVHSMVSYFATHESTDPNWQVWGGTEGRKWAEKIERKVGSDTVIKAVQDIPGLKHIAEGDLQKCENCQHFRDMACGYCQKYDSKIQPDWVCQSWDKSSGHPDAAPIAEQGGMLMDAQKAVSTPTETTSTSETEAVKAEPVTESTTTEDSKACKADDVDKAITEAEKLGKAVGIENKNFDKSLPYDDEFEKRIPKKEGEPKSPPKGYPKDAKLYGDPANFSWPCDNPGRCASAMAYYNAGKGKGKYDEREWRILGRRIARLVNQHGAKDGTVKFNPRTGKLEREAEGKKMAKDLKTARTLVGEVRGKLDSAPEGMTPELIAQAASALDVVMNELSEATNEQGAVIGAEPPAVKAAKPETKPSPETTSSPSSETTESPKTVKKEDKPMSDTTTSPTTSVPSQADVKKVEPMPTQPPVAYQTFNINTGNVHLPEFISALADEGNMFKAQKIAGQGSSFDEMFAKAQIDLLNQGGWTSANARRGIGGLPAAGQDLCFNADWGGKDEQLKKAITLSSIPGIYLIRLAKLMLPVYAGLRNRLPTQTAATGSNQAIWRVKSGFGTFSFVDALMSAENTTGASVTDTFLSFTAPYQRVTVNDNVTLEAVYTTRQYDDPLQVAIIGSLSTLLQSEEMKIMGDNYTDLGAPSGTPVAAAVAGAGFSAGTADTFKVSALSYIGTLVPAKGQVGAVDAVGESTPSSVSSPTVNGTTSTSVTLTWNAVKGAASYNIYWGLNGANWYWVKTSTATSCSISAAEVAAALATNTPNTGDESGNAYGYEGLIAWAEKSTIYSQVTTLRKFTDQAGAALTTTSSGISEIDSVLSYLWTNWKTAPSLMVSSPASHQHFSEKIMAANNPAMYRVETNTNLAGAIVGGVFVTGYHNKFANYASGLPRVMDTMAHPNMPDGTFLFLSENVPYPMAREARGLALDTLIPYTYFPLAAATTINYPFAMLCSETPICFHPAGQAAIVGVSIV